VSATEITASVIALTGQERRELIALIEDSGDISRQLASVLEMLKAEPNINRLAVAALLGITEDVAA
jgi:hypothetical protein